MFPYSKHEADIYFEPACGGGPGEFEGYGPRQVSCKACGYTGFWKLVNGKWTIGGHDCSIDRYINRLRKRIERKRKGTGQ